MKSVRATNFPTMEELQEQAIKENKRIRQIAVIAAILLLLCLVAGVALGRQRAINTELAAERGALQNEETDPAADALDRYKDEAFLYKIYSDNGDEYRVAHEEHLMQTKRLLLVQYEAEDLADAVDAALGIR